MREGMLFFDNSEVRGLNAKIERAAEVYAIKNNGERPTLCFVHPTMLLDGPASVPGITVRATNSVLPSHFWIGVLTTDDQVS